MNSSEENQVLYSCNYCEFESIQSFKYCSNCGKPSLDHTTSQKVKIKRVDSNIKLLFGYVLFIAFFLLLGSKFDDSFKNDVLLSILFAIIALVFAFIQPQVWILFRQFKVRFLPLILMVIITLISAFTINYVADNVNEEIFGYSEQWMPIYEESSYPLFFAILFVGVFPAVFEELAFRGFLFNNLKFISGAKAAILGSTFLFALIHMSLLSLLWILPFGLILAYYRNKYSTIYYGMIGHFIHNTTVVLIEYYQWIN